MIKWTFFPDNGGQAMGVNDAGIQTFKGDLEWSLAREILQNSVDAHDRAVATNKPVKVVFERQELKRAHIPGIDDLADTYKRCAKFWNDDHKAVEIFGRAREIALGTKIPVLRVGDYNTTGVVGDDRKKGYNWYKLVRSSGSSSKAGGEGGSYGIGKNAPFAASAMQVVFYSTCTGQKQRAFQGVARLVTHERERLHSVQPTAYLGGDNGASVRSKSDIPARFARDQLGTDVYIVGYQGGPHWARDITRDVLTNFWPAIHNGKLEAKVDNTTISRSTLEGLLEKHSGDEEFTAHLYYKAFTDKDAVKTVRTLPILGEVTLWLLKGESFPKRVAMVRKSGMVIQHKTFGSPTPYCGVFECKNDAGNKILREMEPPRHDEWDPDHPEKGAHKKTFAELRDFIRECVGQLAPVTADEVLDVPDLASLLPDDDDSMDEKFDDDGSKSGGKGESFDRRPSARKVDTKTFRSLQVARGKTSGDEGDDDTGAGGHGEGENNDSDGGNGDNDDSKKGGGGGGRALLEPPVQFRVFPRDLKRGLYVVVVAPQPRHRGQVKLSLNAVGDDAKPAPLAIASARLVGGPSVRVRNGTDIGPLKLQPKRALRLEVVLKSPHRLAIEVEAYEA
jgi:hypothetical protein